MATIDGLGLIEPSTISKALAVVPITRNSSVTYHEIQLLGSPNSTTLLALAEVMGTDPASTTVGLVTRPGRPSLLTVASTAGTDTLAVIVAGSTAAGTGSIFVSAFTVDSTMTGPIRCGFYSQAGGASSLVWPFTLWAGGGAINVSQSVASPGYLFKTSTGSTLTFQVSSTGPFRVGLTYSTGA